MPMGDPSAFTAQLNYDNIQKPECDNDVVWFAKTSWVDIVEEMVASNNLLHRLEELGRIAGMPEQNLEAFAEMRCVMWEEFAKRFLKGSQDCPQICVEYEERMGEISRRVECPPGLSGGMGGGIDNAG